MATSRNGKPKMLAVQYLAPAAFLARSIPVKSPLDGQTVWAVRLVSDEELWRRVEDLTDDEFRRLCRLWKGRREDPWLTVPELRAAHDAILQLTTAPARLQKRRGRHRGRLGADPIKFEVTRQFLKRLHEVTLQALSDAEPGKGDSRAITQRILSGLTQRCVITKGPLKDQIVQWDRLHTEALRRRLQDWVRDTRRLQLRSNQSRAAEIVLAFLLDLEPDKDPLSIRHLQRILKQTTSPRPFQDTIPPLSV